MDQVAQEDQAAREDLVDQEVQWVLVVPEVLTIAC